MDAQQGTQPVQPPTVIVVERNRGIQYPPYMQRGTKMFGMDVRAGCIVVFLIFGILLILLGFLLIEVIVLADMYAIPIPILIVMWSLGAFLIYCFIKAKRKSLREFNALPNDHPDRAKYSIFTEPGAPYPVANVYHFPTTAQGPSDGRGQAAVTPGHASPHRNYPPAQEDPTPQGYHRLPHGPSAPPLQEPERKFTDDPPPYSEI